MELGEWNEATHKQVAKQGKKMVSVDHKSNFEQNLMIKKFKKLNVWGWAYWNWNYVSHPVPNFNLVKVKNNGHIQTTQYFSILKSVFDKNY